MIENISNKQLKARIVDISYRHKLSHLGSTLSAVDIIDEVYKAKKDCEPFVLSEGHAGLALYTVIEKYLGLDAEEMLCRQGIHPDRPLGFCYFEGVKFNPIDCSTGSLGQGLPIALGMALANRQKDVYCLISDGECAEGSIWESLRIADQRTADNLKIYTNFNGYGAYGEIEIGKLTTRVHAFWDKVNIRNTTVEQLPFLKGLGAHYLTMNEGQYKEAMEVLK